MSQIDTSRVTARRQLRFARIDEMFADVDRLVEADRAGRLTRLGNWTLGQTLGHLATWAEFAYTGTPLRIPWFVRVLSRLGKQRYIHGSLQSGFRIPGVEGGTVGADPLSTDEGYARFRAIFERLQHEPPTLTHPLFGRLTHDEWMQLHLRHAELHLSFLRAE